MHSSQEELFYKVVEKQCCVKRNEEDPTQIGGGLNIFWLLGLDENETDSVKIDNICNQRIKNCCDLEHTDLDKANEWKFAIHEFMVKSKDRAYLKTYRNELYQKRFEKLSREAQILSLSGAPQNVAEIFLQKKAERLGFPKSDINKAVSELVNRFKWINTL